MVLGASLLELLLPLLLHLATATDAKADVSTPPPSCREKCGDIGIPYPFGVGDGCYAKEYPDFNITCNETTNPPTPFFGNYEIMDISITGELRVKGLTAYACYNESGWTESMVNQLSLDASNLSFSHTQNKFVVLGCDTFAFINGTQGVIYSSGCMSTCESFDSVVGAGGNCTGVGCCETKIPKGLSEFNTWIGSFTNHSRCLDFNPCSYAFLVENNYTFRASDLNYTKKDYEPPIILDWFIGNRTCEEAKTKPAYPPFACRGNNSECFDSNSGKGYNCRCSLGYEGNPYLLGGCRDVDECFRNLTICPSNGTCANTEGSYNCTCPEGTAADDPKIGPCIAIDNKKQGIPLLLKLGVGVGLGLLFLMAAGSCLCWRRQRSKLVEQTMKFTELKQKMFEQNGGLFLQELISSQHGNTFRIFTEEELERATNNFEESRIIGRGGHGIVYKGRLEDNTEVAIKKSKMVDDRKSKEFAREIGILSQINHVNVVKLLGCCLEVEIPMLVYEFVQCGTLYEFVHRRKHGGPISLDTRLRIATEAAEALAYLHSYASRPILHGDVKTSNILLDEQYRAKVSDFGASTLAPVDEIQLATVVQGTCGYLDPEYMQTYRLTVKSDVYSFGVVLAELLTGKKPLQLRGPEDERGLAVNFVSSLRQNKLMQILDARVVEDGEPGKLWEIAELAGRCLSMCGDDRPTMKEVVTVLHISRRSGVNPSTPHAPEVAESPLSGGEPSTYESCDATAGYLSKENPAMFEIEAGR